MTNIEYNTKPVIHYDSHERVVSLEIPSVRGLVIREYVRDSDGNYFKKVYHRQNSGRLVPVTNPLRLSLKELAALRLEDKISINRIFETSGRSNIANLLARLNIQTEES